MKSWGNSIYLLRMSIMRSKLENKRYTILLMQRLLCVVIGGLAFFMPVKGQKDGVVYVKTSPIMTPATDSLEPAMMQPYATIRQVKMIGVGATQLLDTYLSAEKYRGVELRVLSQTERKKVDKVFSYEWLHEGGLVHAKNRSGNASEMAGSYHAAYGYYYNMDLLNSRLSLRLGARVGGYLGFVYNSRNSNNPAQARVALHLMPTAAAAYRFHWGGRPLAIHYEVSMPLCGVMFSPNYGQSYYEIFSKGNYDRNIVPVTIASTPSLRQTIALDFHWGRTTWRVGYWGDYQQARVNQLKRHSYTHTLMVGYVQQFTLLK